MPRVDLTSVVLPDDSVWVGYRYREYRIRIRGEAGSVEIPLIQDADESDRQFRARLKRVVEDTRRAVADGRK